MSIFLMCLTIFFCRIVDVSLGTVRTIFIVKNKVMLAAFVGFVEVFIWFTIVKEALNVGTTSIWVGVAYAAGFASGTLLGGILARFLIRSKVCVQIISSSRDEELLKTIRSAGYPMTVIDGYGQLRSGEKYLIFIEIDSRRTKELSKLVLSVDSSAFITVNEIKSAYNGFFAETK